MRITFTPETLKLREDVLVKLYIYFCADNNTFILTMYLVCRHNAHGAHDTVSIV